MPLQEDAEEPAGAEDAEVVAAQALPAVTIRRPQCSKAARAVAAVAARRSRS